MILGLLIQLPSDAPLPPLRKVQTQIYSRLSSGDVHFVKGNTLYIGGKDCSAYDLPSLKRKWSSALPGYMMAQDMTVLNGVVYLTRSGYEEGGILNAFDAETGKPLWNIDSKVDRSTFDVDGKYAYWVAKPRVISRIDLRTRQMSDIYSWPKQVGGNPTAPYAGELSASNGVVVASVPGSLSCIAASTGKQVWSRRDLRAPLRHPTAVGNVLLAWSTDQLVGMSLKSGKTLWKKLLPIGSGVAIWNGRFVYTTVDKLQIISVADGRLVKELPFPLQEYETAQLKQIGNELWAMGNYKLVILNPDLKVVWSGPDPGLDIPIWADSSSVVTMDDFRLTRYGKGVEEEPRTSSPAEAARNLASRYEELSKSERKNLFELGEPALEPLLGLYQRAVEEEKKRDKREYRTSIVDYEELADAIGKLVNSANIDKVIAAAASLDNKSESKQRLFELLAARPNDPVVVSAFIAALGENPAVSQEPTDATTIAAGYLTECERPEAIAYVEKQFSKGNKGFAEAYNNLVRIGGDEGVRLVREAKHKRALLKPLAARVLEDIRSGYHRNEKQPFSTRKDPSGRVFGLAHSIMLGDSDDIWLVEKINGQWTNPLLTGISTWVGRRIAFRQDEDDEEHKSNAKRQLEKNWVTILKSLSAIQKDSDHDGLTDLVEERLGTNPNKRDTDGDGTPDDVDPWPNAPSRPLSEEEAILAAVFEARFHNLEGEGSDVLGMPGGVKPFEMPGRSGPTLWSSEDDSEHLTTNLSGLYERGVGIIGLGGRGENEPTKPTWSKTTLGKMIEWDAVKQEATVRISVYYGGLAGSGYVCTVKKFGSDWLVTSLRMEYVS